MADLIHRHDLPAWTFRDTREGMELAYGILWECWIDKDTEDGVAASMAREILRAVLSQKECGEGIALARSMRAAGTPLPDSETVCSGVDYEKLEDVLVVSVTRGG